MQLLATFIYFLRAKADTAIVRLSHRNSVCLFVRLFVTRVDQTKTVKNGRLKQNERLFLLQPKSCTTSIHSYTMQ